jgi:hypothetical protein
LEAAVEAIGSESILFGGMSNQPLADAVVHDRDPPKVRTASMIAPPIARAIQRVMADGSLSDHC